MRSPLWLPYTQMKHAAPPVPIIGAQGAQLHLADGRTLVDGVASWWAVVHGYQHPALVAALQQQASTLCHVMLGGMVAPITQQLAERLCSEVLNGAFEHVFFTDSGSVAVEVAMKMALQYWSNQGKARKNRFICFNHSYHGDTFGAMSVSDPLQGMHKAFKNNVTMQYAMDIPTGEYDWQEFEATLAAIAPNVAGLIIEPLVQGAGGMLFHSADTLAEIHRLCKAHDLLFIADEIATGFGRTGSMFACEEAGIAPDILCLGKALSAGMAPLAATLTTRAVHDAFYDDDVSKAFMHGPTFMGNALACAVANASLELFATQPRLEQTASIEEQLYAGLQPLQRLEQVADIRVRGAIGVVEIIPKLDPLRRQELRLLAIEHGCWIRPLEQVIYLMPPLTITEAELTQLLDCVKTLVQHTGQWV